ncbi:MAG TPA: nitrous oxide reductase accessory protein NosL [Azospirillum sp.]|nr:nitrous oxide reductase accessory protein NosL [Azospirillum sp.]
MRTVLNAALLAAALLGPLSACKQERAETAPPPPLALTADAVGHYCGMNLADHPGPKGQVILKGEARPVWLSSVRDTFAFTMLPEEPKDYRAVYVTDMGKAPDPRKPDLSVWIEARKAWYVLGSGHKGGMGASEPFPFADESAARAFAAAQGGVVKRFAEVTEDEILTPDPTADEAQPMPRHEQAADDTKHAPAAHGGHGDHTAKRQP